MAAERVAPRRTLRETLAQPQVVRSGALQGTGVALHFADGTLTIDAHPSLREPGLTLRDADVVGLQLSRSEVDAVQPWWARILGLRPRRTALLHVELRTRAHGRLRLSAPVSEPWRVADLPHLHAPGPLVEWGGLESLLGALVAGDVRVVEMPATALAGLDALRLADAQVVRQGALAGLYRAGRLVLELPFGELVEVAAVRPHPGADRLELADLPAGQVAVRMGAVRAGQRVVFVPAGTAVPRGVGKALRIESYLDAKRRVREVAIRGEQSVGLVLDLEDHLESLLALGARVVAELVRVESVDGDGPDGLQWLTARDVRDGGRPLRCAALTGQLRPGEVALCVTHGAKVVRRLARQLGLERFAREGRIETPKRGWLRRAHGLLVPAGDLGHGL